MSTKEPHPQADILKAIAEDKDAQIEALFCNKWELRSVEYMLRNPGYIYRIAPKPDAEGWIKWEGGENPVPGKCVQVKLADSRMDDLVVVRNANHLDWPHRKYPSDIIAYRVVEPKREKVYYLWAEKSRIFGRLECSKHMSTADDPPFPGAIRLDWSRTVIQEGK